MECAVDAKMWHTGKCKTQNEVNEYLYTAIVRSKMADAGDFYSDDFRIIYSGTAADRSRQVGVAIILTKQMGLR